jgi:hypothetical protein
VPIKRASSFVAYIFMFVLQSSSAQAAQCYRVVLKATVSTWADPLGHIWVAFGCRREAQVYGFYPGGDGKSAVWRLAGDVADDTWTKADVSYGFAVGAEFYERGLRVVEDYRRKRYIFPVRNCKNMVREVATAVGLRAPSDYLVSPADYLARIVESNDHRSCSPCPRGWFKCSCPSIHKAKCHVDGYECKEWAMEVPCEANCECTGRAP